MIASNLEQKKTLTTSPNEEKSLIRINSMSSVISSLLSSGLRDATASISMERQASLKRLEIMRKSDHKKRIKEIVVD